MTSMNRKNKRTLTWQKHSARAPSKGSGASKRANRRNSTDWNNSSENVDKLRMRPDSTKNVCAQKLKRWLRPNVFAKKPKNKRLERRLRPNVFAKKPKNKRLERRLRPNAFAKKPKNKRLERRQRLNVFAKKPKNKRSKRRRDKSASHRKRVSQKSALRKRQNGWPGKERYNSNGLQTP